MLLSGTGNLGKELGNICAFAHNVTATTSNADNKDLETKTREY